MPNLYQGRCWKLPDGVSSDQLIAPPHVFDFEPDILRRHLLTEINPEIAKNARPGDVLVAGARFAHGSNHTHPFIAMRAMGLGLICRSISRGPYRLCVFMGVPILTIEPDVFAAINDKDRLDVDFATGHIVNNNSGASLQAAPLPPFLMDIIEAGGGLEYAMAQKRKGGSNADHH